MTTDNTMRGAFERMYRNDVEKLARGKYLKQDYDHHNTQVAWEVFQHAWPIIRAEGYKAGMEDAQEAIERLNERAGDAASYDQRGMYPCEEAKFEALREAARVVRDLAIRAEIGKEG